MTAQRATPHEPVMLNTTLAWLDVSEGQWYLDATFGAGGHSRAILAAGGSVLALDQDPQVRRYARELEELAAERFLFIEGNFRELEGLLSQAAPGPLGGVIFDLGVSSMQLDEADRGFSFRQPGPLDMRMSSHGPSAADLVNDCSQEELAAIIYKYGEERYSRRIARAIVEARSDAPITRTDTLTEIITRAYPQKSRRDHPARRTFQALRIAVNDELDALEQALAAAARVLAPEGRLLVLSYHSLEDRIVKHSLRDSKILVPLVKKPLTADDHEIRMNPRARSAKLRVAAKRTPGGGSHE